MATTPPREQAPEPEASEPEPEVDADDQVRESLHDIAKDADSFGGFLSKAMKKHPGVEDGPLAAELLDESGGIWAKANA